jgi:hypothetical protein
MVTPSHIRLRGQAVRVLGDRALQAWCLVRTGVGEGSPTDGGRRERRGKGGQAPLIIFWLCMRSLYGLDLSRNGSQESHGT